jgi:hypothetical protein
MKRRWYLKPLGYIVATIGGAIALGCAASVVGEAISRHMIEEYARRNYSTGDDLLNTVFFLSDPVVWAFSINVPILAALAGALAGAVAGALGAFGFFRARDRGRVLRCYLDGITDPSELSQHTGFSKRKVTGAIRKLQKKGTIGRSAVSSEQERHACP